jgi:hypothetical protein
MRSSASAAWLCDAALGATRRTGMVGWIRPRGWGLPELPGRTSQLGLRGVPRIVGKRVQGIRHGVASATGHAIGYVATGIILPVDEAIGLVEWGDEDE